MTAAGAAGAAETHRQLLLDAREAAEQRVAQLRQEIQQLVAATADANTDDEHDPEGPTIAYERQQVAALLLAASRRLADLNQALAREATGGYGQCERCGQPIPPQRLAARPSATTCVGCASRR